ncbi:glycosyltransferase family 2 protein [Bowmanella denitrificans]|uniref:Glycosyltransferase family 2 protein n=1 Tax=Bowmanella denitrificans TaxID=366582 RepID=A0ABP3H3C4_9ALTE|nr:glycosyltransferase family 2 protein [Bowmanella denitrificans]
MIELSVVVPIKNEQDNIHPLIREICQNLEGLISYEIIYVDDGSDDQSFQILESLQQTGDVALRILRNPHSRGQSTAIHLGIHAAKGRLIATLDGDGQNDPADIPAMLTLAKDFAPEQDFLIAGYRKNRHDSAWKLLQSRIANKIRATLLGDNTPDTGCGLKLFPRQTFLKLPYFDHMHRFLPALVQRCGGQVKISVVNHRARMAGISKYGMLNRAWVGLVDLFGVMWLQRRNRLTTECREYRHDQSGA